MPIPAFTMVRFGCSRCADPGVHDGPISAAEASGVDHDRSRVRVANSQGALLALRRSLSFVFVVSGLLASLGACARAAPAVEDASSPLSSFGMVVTDEPVEAIADPLRVMSPAKRELLACATRGKSGDVIGSAVVVFEVGANGDVGSVDVQQASSLGPENAACYRAVFQRMHFPRGKPARVTAETTFSVVWPARDR